MSRVHLTEEEVYDIFRNIFHNEEDAHLHRLRSQYHDGLEYHYKIQTEAATMSSFVVTTDAQPTSWCAKPVGQSGGALGACGFTSREQCRDFTETRSVQYACVPSKARH